MNKVCERCGAPIPPRIGPGGQRKRCATCSPSRGRGKNQQAGPPVAVLPAPATGETVTEATRTLLATHTGALEHPMGRAALVLAGRIDSTSESTAAVTAAAKQLDSCIRIALNETEPVEESPLDRIRARRARLGQPDPVTDQAQARGGGGRSR